jgi:endogenous inhibitor of DNA gyrase (YacG/DUF329 family)
MSAAISKNSKCPVCGSPTAAEPDPFCSRRCADVDLGRWLGGNYSIPGDPAEDEDGVPALPSNDN